MPLYDYYEMYRPLYTSAQQDQIRQATNQARKLAAAQIGRRVPGGYEGLGGFVEDPLVATHIRLAKECALEQFRGLPVMPEDGDVSFRFPELDPVGQYSIIDMKLAHRELMIQNAAQILGKEARQKLAQLQQTLKGDEAFRRIEDQMRETAQMHRCLTRASKLCWGIEGRELLHQQARGLENSPSVMQYDLLLQGIEYAVGLCPEAKEVPAEVEALYRELGIPMPVLMAKGPVRPEGLCIRFQDFDGQMRQRWYANPSNWGVESSAEPEYRTQETCVAVKYFAMATVSGALKPVYAHVRPLGLQPVDLLSIDGVPLRESLEAGGISGLSPYQMDEMVSAAIAAALIAEHKVETLLPDATGQVLERKIPIRKDGYVPNRQIQSIYDAWMQFITRQSMYFGKPMG